MASGAILWQRDAAGEAVTVMALEMRQGKPRYNFLGGKRDTEDETPQIVAQREASEESGEALSAEARRSMTQGDAMRPVLWHAGGKYCLFVFELPPADADLVERVCARGGQPDSGDPELLSLHWVPLRHLLTATWCKANLHGYVSDQLTLLRPYLAAIVEGRPPLLGAQVGDAVPLPFGAPALFVERQHGDETMRVLVSGRSATPAIRGSDGAGRAQPMGEAAVASVAAAERARLHAQKQQDGRGASGYAVAAPAGASVGADAARAAGTTSNGGEEEQQSMDRCPFRQIRAIHDDSMIRVYQAYNDKIADLVVDANSFQPAADAGVWSTTRMTWVKPSAVWMAYRCGWSTMKDKNQARVLALDLSRRRFEELMMTARLSHGDDGGHPKDGPVVVQWDPERVMDPSAPPKQVYTRGLPAVRSIQIGLRAPATASLFLDGSFLIRITDVTPRFRAAAAALSAGDVPAATAALWPDGADAERAMEVPPALRGVLQMDVQTDGGGPQALRQGDAAPPMQPPHAAHASSPPRGPRQEKEGRAPSSFPADPRPMWIKQPRVCRNFGTEAGCRFGAGCRFVHASPLAPTGATSAVAGVSDELANMAIAAPAPAPAPAAAPYRMPYDALGGMGDRRRNRPEDRP